MNLINTNIEFNLVHQIKYLVIHGCNKSQKLHVMCLRHLNKWSKNMACLLFNKEILYTILELCQITWLACHSEYEDHVILILFL